MGVEIRGLEEAKKALERMKRNVQQLEGKHSINAKELLNESFMKTHSKYKSLEELATAGGFLKAGERLTQDRFHGIPDSEWDAWVAKATDFLTWKAMLDAATKEYVKRRMFEGV